MMGATILLTTTCILSFLPRMPFAATGLIRPVHTPDVKMCVAQAIRKSYDGLPTDFRREESKGSQKNTNTHTHKPLCVHERHIQADISVSSAFVFGCGASIFPFAISLRFRRCAHWPFQLVLGVGSLHTFLLWIWILHAHQLAVVFTAFSLACGVADLR